MNRAGKEDLLGKAQTNAGARVCEPLIWWRDRLATTHAA
jgi:hypothetical protein